MPLNDFLERGCGLGYHAARLVDQNGRQENGGQNVRDECDQRYNDSDLRMTGPNGPTIRPHPRL